MNTRPLAVMSMLVAFCAAGLSARSASQPAHAPAINMESMLDTFFDNDSGIIAFDRFVIAFAPEGGLDAEVVVMNADRKIVAKFPFFEDYKVRDGVFAVASVQGPADVALTEPGDYNLIFTVAGKPVSRLPFLLERSTGGDPLNPKTTYRLRGAWSKVGHLTMRTFKDQPVPVLSLWLGSNDLSDGAAKDMFRAQLLRNGEMIAISKKGLGSYAAGHYKRTTIDLFKPHDDRQSQNAELFTMSDWTQDGTYELRITRQSDDAVLRSFTYQASGRAIKPLAQTELTYEPALDYITPRVQKKNTSTFEVVEAIWLECK